MNVPSPPRSDLTAPPKHRSKIRSRLLIASLLLILAILGWEYLGIYYHDRSLARLQQELQRHQATGQHLRRDEVSKLLQGSPTRESESGLTEFVDYYTWRGLIHSSHIRVTANKSDAVLIAENDLFGIVKPTSHRATPPVTHKPPRPPSPEALARVDEALARAEQLFRQAGTGSIEFMNQLWSVSQDLPELEVSTVKGQWKWNSFKFSRKECGLFAVRITLPSTPPSTPAPEAYLVSWMNMGNSSGIIAVRDYHSTTSDQYTHWFDQEFNVKIDGIDLPDENLVRFRWFPGKYEGSNRDFILWYVTYDDRRDVDFECKALLYAAKPEQPQQSRAGADQIADFLGLKTNIRRFEPTDDGRRQAMSVVNNRLSGGVAHGFDHGAVMPGRILHSVAERFDELSCSKTTGKANWQKLTFPIEKMSAVRVRIPASVAPHAEIYGAVISKQEVAIGWDKAGPVFGDFETHRIKDSQFTESPVQSPANLLLFSNVDFVKGIDEFVFWVHKTQPGDDPVYITLSVLPHNPANDTYERIAANGRPRSSALIAGITLPPPPAPVGSTVLACHERPILSLIFTPDSSRLLSIDVLGHTQIWNVEERLFEGQIDIPFNATHVVLVDPSGQTLVAENDAILRWNLASRESLPKLDTSVINNSGVRAVAFGPMPDELAVIHRKNGSLFEHEHFIGIHSLRDEQSFRLSKAMRDSTKSNYYSLVYLPALNVFAAGRTRDDRAGTIAASIEIWPPDFSKPIQELPMGTHADTGQIHELNPVWISCHPNGRRLAAASERGELKVWDTGTWTELMAIHLEARSAPPSNAFLPRTSKTFLSVSLAPDGETVAATEQFHEAVTTWKISDGTTQTRWTVDDTPVTMMNYSPNGKWVATADAKGVIRLWKND